MSLPIFKVIKPGLQTTVQDLGRYGFQQFGVGPSGAMDPYSMKAANILAGNSLGSAVLEVSLIGPKLEVLCDTTAAVCGGDFSLSIDGLEAPLWKSFLLKKGQVLSFGQCRSGARAYLAVSGGIDIPEVLGSKSTYNNGGFGGYEGRVLKSGDLLSGQPAVRKPLKAWHPERIPTYPKLAAVRVILGPHENRITEESIKRFLTEEYIVTSKSNRMGYQLTGPKLEHVNGPDIISDPVPLGGIQVPASGQPIILLADRQTTGGYTRIATVISVDIPKLAQAVSGTIVRFSAVSVEEAQELYLKRNSLFRIFALCTK